MKQSTAEKKAAIERADGLGPRMLAILQHSIAPWKREVVGDEEAQLAEIKRRPVRHKYDAEEAKRRLGTKPAKRGRTSRSKPATASD